jgi:hypothetical protein
MKQNKIKVILFAAIGAILLMVLLFFAFSLLDSGGGFSHEHDFKEVAGSNADTHTLKCKCGKTQDVKHVYGEEYEMHTEPTCAQKGVGLFTCKVCENTALRELDIEIEHKYRNNLCSNCGYIGTTDESFFDFTLLEDGTYSVSVKKDASDLPKNVGIPESYEGKPITVIAEAAFEGNKMLLGVRIPDTVTTIGYAAFYDCAKLTNIQMGSKVVLLERFAFGGCSTLAEIVLPDSIEKISAYAFSDCSYIKKLTLPKNLKFIGNSAFANCKMLTSVKANGRLLETIEENAFRECLRLETVVLSNSVKFIGTAAFYDCGSLKEINIPTNVEYIGDEAFYNCKNLNCKIVFPETLKYLGDEAFALCRSLETVTFPANMLNIRSGVFKSCASLTIPALPEGLEEIGYAAFYKCYKLPASLPVSLEKIGSHAFYSCEVGGKINYAGTRSEFSAIAIEDSAFSSSDATIVCTDGEIYPG